MAKAEMTFLEERTIGPELGQDSIDAGRIACLGNGRESVGGGRSGPRAEPDRADWAVDTAPLLFRICLFDRTQALGVGRGGTLVQPIGGDAWRVPRVQLDVLRIPLALRTGDRDVSVGVRRITQGQGPVASLTVHHLP